MRVLKSHPFSHRPDQPTDCDLSFLSGTQCKVNHGHLLFKQDHTALVGHGKVKWPIRVALVSSFCSMTRLGVFLLPLGWDASPSQGLSPVLDSLVPIYTPGCRGTVREKCLAQEYNIMPLVRARSQTSRPGGECTNHEATAPLPGGSCS